jgi:hypothetical protein
MAAAAPVVTGGNCTCITGAIPNIEWGATLRRPRMANLRRAPPMSSGLTTTFTRCEMLFFTTPFRAFFLGFGLERRLYVRGIYT